MKPQIQTKSRSLAVKALLENGAALNSEVLVSACYSNLAHKVDAASHRSCKGELFGSQVPPASSGVKIGASLDDLLAQPP